MLAKKFMLLLVFLLLPSLASAKISCRDCKVNQCVCTITECESGILNIFSSSCGMEPDYEFIFSDGYLRWSPKTAKSYYVKALCSDGETQSDCELITVRLEEETTTTTTRPTTTTTTIPPAAATGPDYLLIVLIIVLILMILFAIYYFFGKKARKTYEELYRKWRR